MFEIILKMIMNLINALALKAFDVLSKNEVFTCLN